MCNHLRRHKPDSFLVAEQDTLLFFYCFQTARVGACECVCGFMWRESFKRRRRRKEGEKKKKKRATTDASWLSIKMQQLSTRWSIIYLQCITMLLTNQWLWQWWFCFTANIKHSDSLPAYYGDCSKGAFGARVLIARSGVCVCVWQWTFSVKAFVFSVLVCRCENCMSAHRSCSWKLYAIDQV